MINGVAAPVDTIAPPPVASIVDLVAAPASIARLALVIPMFRESQRIDATIRTLAASNLNDGTMSFVFVDDGSGDATAAQARRSIVDHDLRNACVEVLPRNRGKGGAVRAGIDLAEGRFVGYLDADLSLDPADVLRALSRLEASGDDLIVGERIVDQRHQPRLRRLASHVFRRLTAGAVDVGVRDPQCAMKLFRSSVAAELFPAVATAGYSFDVELLGRARRAGFRMSEMPLAWQHQPGSKVNPFVDGLRMARELRRIRRLLGSPA